MFTRLGLTLSLGLLTIGAACAQETGYSRVAMVVRALAFKWILFRCWKDTSHTAKKSIGKLWPVANDAPAKAHLCNSSGKIAPASAKSLRLPLDASAQNVS
jgi:hypothetical protein